MARRATRLGGDDRPAGRPPRARTRPCASRRPSPRRFADALAHVAAPTQSPRRPRSWPARVARADVVLRPTNLAPSASTIRLNAPPRRPRALAEEPQPPAPPPSPRGGGGRERRVRDEGAEPAVRARVRARAEPLERRQQPEDRPVLASARDPQLDDRHAELVVGHLILESLGRLVEAVAVGQAERAQRSRACAPRAARAATGRRSRAGHRGNALQPHRRACPPRVYARAGRDPGSGSWLRWMMAASTNWFLALLFASAARSSSARCRREPARARGLAASSVLVRLLAPAAGARRRQRRRCRRCAASARSSPARTRGRPRDGRCAVPRGRRRDDGGATRRAAPRRRPRSPRERGGRRRRRRRWSLEVPPLDLGSLKSVAAGDARHARGDPAVDVLVLNAGVMAIPERSVTVDGLERHFVNHPGHLRHRAALARRAQGVAGGGAARASSSSRPTRTRRASCGSTTSSARRRQPRPTASPFCLV